jgi:hypothetical protein
MMLFVEYDVRSDGTIEVVGLINAIEENGDDPGGEAWMVWRKSFEDGAMGCVAVQPDDLAQMEAAEEPNALANIVERIILTDRRSKEEVR